MVRLQYKTNLDFDLFYLVPSGHPLVHVSYIFSALYTTYTASSSPAADAAHISEVEVFAEFMTLSGYFMPRRKIECFRPGSSSDLSRHSLLCFRVELH